MYPHLLRKAESRLARAGISQKPTPVYDQVPPPFAEGAVGCVISAVACIPTHNTSVLVFHFFSI